jgi:hypothetical protein
MKKLGLGSLDQMVINLKRSIKGIKHLDEAVSSILMIEDDKTPFTYEDYLFKLNKAQQAWEHDHPCEEPKAVNAARVFTGNQASSSSSSSAQSGSRSSSGSSSSSSDGKQDDEEEKGRCPFCSARNKPVPTKLHLNNVGTTPSTRRRARGTMARPATSSAKARMARSFRRVASGATRIETTEAQDLAAVGTKTVATHALVVADTRTLVTTFWIS